MRTDWTPVWEPTPLPPREIPVVTGPVCKDCGKPVSAKASSTRCRPCASVARRGARYVTKNPRSGRLCGCGEPLSPTSRRTTVLCRKCAAREREVMKVKSSTPIRPVRVELPHYSTSPRPKQVKGSFDLTACGVGGHIDTYNVYVGVSLVARVDRVGKQWCVRGREDLGLHDKPGLAAKALVEEKTNGSGMSDLQPDGEAESQGEV